MHILLLQPIAQEFILRMLCKIEYLALISKPNTTTESILTILMQKDDRRLRENEICAKAKK